MDSKAGWELYRSLLGVLDEGSLSGAARALGLTQPTVGRHIAALEATLGVALFTRSQQGLAPTEAALALKSYAQGMASMAAALERAATGQGQQVKGTVRITASEVVGVEVLPPILVALRQQHPGLKIELVLSNRVQDLLQREADIAVRMVRPEQQALLARRVGHIALGLHAHADYLARHGTPRTLDDLRGHSLVGFDQPGAFVRSMAKSLPGITRELFSLRSDNDLAQLALVRAGAGLGFCQVPLARRHGQLVRVLPRQLALKLDTWVTMQEDLRSTPRCRAAFDGLVQGLQQYCTAAT